MKSSIPVLRGTSIFRPGELIYINKSSEEYEEYMHMMHKHDFIELVYVISGKGRHVVQDNEYELSKGDLFIINHNVAHGFYPLKEGIDEPVVFNCLFMPEYLDSSLLSNSNFEDIVSSFLFKSLFPDKSIVLPDLKLIGSQYNEVGEIFSKMYVEYTSKPRGYYDILRAYLIELLIKIFRLIESSKNPSPDKNREIINKAIFLLKQGYNQDIRLEDIAMKCFISKNYFSKLFKDVTGTKFSDYVQKVRIDEACALIRSTDIKVIDIALQTGYSDMKFFYEVFKRHTGMTPGEYRKRG